MDKINLRREKRDYRIPQTEMPSFYNKNTTKGKKRQQTVERTQVWENRVQHPVLVLSRSDPSDSGLYSPLGLS